MRSSPATDVTTKTAWLLAIALLVGAATVSAQELRMVPVTVDGATVRLAVRIYPPATPGPAPTLVFNHGSTQTLMKRGAAYPGEMLWLYGDADPFYPLSHSRGSFAAFTGAGGVGLFLEFPAPPGSDGHRISGFPEMWSTHVESYLMRLGLPATPR